MISPLPASIPLALTPHGAFNARRPSDTSLPETHRHQACDLVAPPGTPVLAVGPGKIIPCDPGIGKAVVKVQLDDGRCAIYCDLGSVAVEVGARVEAGDVIGRVWHEGFVHFGVRLSRDGAFVDPWPVIAGTV